MKPSRRLSLVLLRPRRPTRKKSPPSQKLGHLFAPKNTYHVHKNKIRPSYKQDSEKVLTSADPFDNSLTGAYLSPSNWYHTAEPICISAREMLASSPDRQRLTKCSPYVSTKSRPDALMKSLFWRPSLIQSLKRSYSSPLGPSRGEAPATPPGLTPGPQISQL